MRFEWVGLVVLGGLLQACTGPVVTDTNAPDDTDTDTDDDSDTEVEVETLTFWSNRAKPTGLQIAPLMECW